jgi:hypothetical protein
MNDLSAEVGRLFEESVGGIANDPNHTSHRLVSDSLLTRITCNHETCSDNLSKFAPVFDTSLKASREASSVIDAYITKSEDVFHKVEAIFQRPEWTTNERVGAFNVATSSTSAAKCTAEGEFYIIKCYDHFYYLYATGTSRCLMVTTDERKALTMVSILLLTPYLLFGDLYAVHGGLVSNGKHNLLISSSSLGGKTTLALLFLANGWSIITEESTYISRHGEPLKFNIRNYFNIRAGTYLEFRDFFVRVGIVSDSFLAMADTAPDELFEIGKRGQISIDFDALCRDGNTAAADRITHVLEISLDKTQSGMTIKESDRANTVERFLEVSLAPTVMLFQDLVDMPHLERNQRREELTRILCDVKSYSVTSGFDYRKHFGVLLKELGLSNG